MSTSAERLKDVEVEAGGQRPADAKVGGQRPADARGQRSESQRGSESKLRGSRLARSGLELEDK